MKFKHGQSLKGKRSREYYSWSSMKERCLNTKSASYKYYGGKGINIDEKWINSFESFFKDMGPRPMGTSLDRIDSGKGYCRENCQWLSHSLQVAKQEITKANKSGYKGVIWHKNIKRWQSFIAINRKSYHLGSFENIEEAYLSRQIVFNQVFSQIAHETDKGLI